MSEGPWTDYQKPQQQVRVTVGDTSMAPYTAAIPQAETANGLPTGALKGILAGEATAPGITSSAGAVTPFQILPTTAQGLGINPGDLLKTPAVAAHTSAKYLAQQLKRFGNLRDAYAAYNAGPGGALKWIAAGRPKDGFGGVGSYVDRASNAAGIQVAQADTGTQNDAPWLDYQGAAASANPGGVGSSAPATAGDTGEPLTPVPPGGPIDPANAWAAAYAKDHPAPPAAPSGFTGLATGMENQLMGAFQKTSPIAGNQPPIGTFRGQVDDSGQAFFTAGDGSTQLFDPAKYVMLNTGTGPSLVYKRSPVTNESLLPALGRVLGIGSLSTAPEIAGAGGVRLPLPPTASQRALGAFERSGITPRSVAATNSGALPGLTHQVFSDFVPSAGTMSAADRAMMNQGGAEADRLASTLGPAGSGVEAGAALQRGALAFKGTPHEDPALTAGETILAPTRATSFAQKTQVLSSRLDAAVPPATETPLPNTVQMFKNITGAFKNPELGQALVNGTIAKWQKIITDAGGKLSWSDARNFRTEIGQLLKEPIVAGSPRAAQLDRLYGAISDDLGATAQATSPQAGMAWKNFNNYYQAGSKRIRDALTGILKTTQGTGGEEQAFSVLTKLGDKGGGLENASKLTAIRRSLPDEEWNNVAAVVLRKLGEPVPSAADMTGTLPAWSPASFVTRYAQLSDTAKNLLFNQAGRADLRAALDDLLASASNLKNMQRFSNTSKTARGAGTMAFYAALFTNFKITAPLSAGAYGAAKLFTNPAVVRLIAKGVSARTPQAFLPIAVQLRALGVTALPPGAQ